MSAAVLLAAGVALAALGGERFVHGAVGIARALRVPPGIVAATIAAFATSTPELAVAVSAAAQGAPAIGVGDALGSSAVNLGLILGLALLLGPMRVERAGLRRDIPVAVAAPLMVALLAADGRLMRTEAAVLLVVFLAWAAVAALQAANARSAAPEVLGDAVTPRAGFNALVGIALLVVAGRLVADAAQHIGDALGLGAFVVGATFVAVGTSTPELATTIIAHRNGHDDVGIGTLIGSNIFNTLLIVGATGLVAPADLQVRNLLPAIAAGALLPLLAVPPQTRVLRPHRGLPLLATYAAFVGALLVVAHR